MKSHMLLSTTPRAMTLRAGNNDSLLVNDGTSAGSWGGVFSGGYGE